MIGFFRDLVKHLFTLLIMAFAGIALWASVDLQSAESRQSNLEKFNSIKPDYQQGGIDTEVLKKEFLKNPIGNRISVERHRRMRFMLINASQERAIGAQIVYAMKERGILWENRWAAARCNAILAKLKESMPAHFTAPEEIYILDTPEINAYCLPGGSIVIFRGLFEAFNDDALASVIAHELGHGTAHHFAEAISKTLIQELAIEELFDKEKTPYKFFGAKIGAFLANLKYSRTQEDEADRLALYFMNKAGFDMRGALKVLTMFKNNDEKYSKLREWLNTHPHPEKRLLNVNTTIAQLKKNPDQTWGGIKDILLEEAKIRAIKAYLEKKNQKLQSVFAL